MRLLFPLIIFFLSVTAIYLYKNATAGLRRWVAIALGLLFIGAWVYALSRFL